MAILESNTDLDVKGRVLATTVPNSTGSIVTWNSTSKVFGLRTNAQIISDLNLSSNFITTNTTQTGLTGNKTSNGIWTLGQVRKAGQTDSSVLLAGGGHRPVSDFALAGGYLSNTIANLGYTELFSGDLNTLPNGSYVQAISASSTNRASGIGTPRSLISFGARNSGDPILQSDILIGTEGFAVRNRGNNTWRTAWHSGNLLQSSIDNWNTAFGWGDHATAGYFKYISILGNESIDNITTSGFYQQGTSANASEANNYPNGAVAGMLRHYNHPNYKEQYYSNRAGSRIWHRTFYSSWNDWVELIHTDNLNTNVSSLGFIKSSALPSVNNGQLTLSTGTGLSGSANFTANQSGNSSFSVGIASTHKLPTVAEWNALPTTNTTYTGSNGIDLVGTDFRLSSSTLASLVLANTAVQPSALSNYYQSGDVNIPALGGDYVVFPKQNGSIVGDFDNITEPGFYKNTMASGSISAPKAGIWWVENHNYTLSSDTRVTQYAHPFRVSDGMWMRNRFNGNWSNWVEFIHSGNLDSYANTLLTGFVPTSRTITINGTTFDLSANRTWNIPDNDTVTRLRGTITGTYTSGDLTLVAGANTTITQSGANITIASTNTNTTYTAGTGLSLTGTVFANTAPNATHTGDVTGSTALTIANSAVTHAKYQNIATQRILGRGATGTGNVQELTLGSNLSLSTSGVLSATNTTYSAGTLALLNAGTNTENRVWGAKPIADYVKQYAATNLGLQGVTDISNWTDNSIKLGGSSSAKPEINIEPKGETNSNRILGEESIMLVAVDNRQGSNTIDYLEYISTNVGVIDEAAVWANAFTLGGDAGYEFGYRSNGNPITNSNPFVKINLRTFKHHSERIIGKTGYIRTQNLQFPPEDGTLATREWLIEDSDPGASVGPNPGFIVSIDGTIRHLRAGNNLNIREVYLDAVDTKNTTGANASNSKMFLVGVLSQTTGENGNQSYSNSKIYATNGTLTATAFNGNASTATKLATARTIRTNLGSTTAVSFDGSGNITPGITGTLPIAHGGTGTTSAGTAAQLTAGTTTTARVWSPKILADYVKEYVHEDKRVVNAIGSYGANNDHGATIIISTSTTGIGFGSASALRDTFEVSLYNNSNGSKDIWGGDGFTYQLQDGTTSSTIKIKARGIGTITRITKGSTAIMLALGDFEI